jgi:hypothetical protein
MTDSPEGKKWWSYGHVWLVIGLPFTVVVASFITLYLAISRPNEVLQLDVYSSGNKGQVSSEVLQKNGGEAPALQGRNHAATGVVPAAAK